MAKVSTSSVTFNFANQLSQIACDNGGINLSNDFSDFPCQPELLNSLIRHLSEGRNKYAPSEGVFELRKVISDYYQNKHGRFYNPETEVTITAGAIQGFYTAISSLVNEGDEVIVFEPVFETYIPAIEARGARPIYFQLNPADFSIDWNSLPKLINNKTKLIIINTPHNPTGTLFSKENLEKLQKMINGTGIQILSDEAFGELIYNQTANTSIASFPKLAEKAILIGSLGKTLCVPGWKIGFCLAPESIMSKFRDAHRYHIYSVNLPIQLALSDYLQGREYWFPFLDEFRDRLNLFRNLMKGSRFSLHPVDGGYFQVMGYENLSKESDIEFSLRLAREVGVTTLPLSLFYHDSVDNQKIRVCFGKSEDDLRKAADRLIRV